MLWAGLLVLGLLGFEAAPNTLLRVLENQYPVPSAAVVQRHVGVIVLGGATQNHASYTAHGQVPLGEAAERLTVLEGHSRTTRENARQVAALLGERCRQPWLLVTSAWHMPRSMAEFESVGCQVTAFPVDFRTGTTTPWTEYALARSLLLWQTALHEWLGRGVYALTR